MSHYRPPEAGTTLYYSLLYCSETQRTHVGRVLFFCATLANTLLDVTEAGVAEQKIHWWHEEIERLFNNAARHPGTLQLAPLVTHYSLSRSSFLDILRANNDEKFLPSQNNETFEQRLVADFSGRLQLCGKILGVTPKLLENTELLSQWAIALGNLDRLHRLRHLYYRGYAVWPESDYTQLGLQPGQLDQTQFASQAMQLLQRRLDLTDKLLRDALLSTDKSPATMPLLIYAKLRHKQLQQWQRQPDKLLTHYMGITPVRKFVHAWWVRRTALV